MASGALFVASFASMGLVILLTSPAAANVTASNRMAVRRSFLFPSNHFYPRRTNRHRENRPATDEDVVDFILGYYEKRNGPADLGYELPALEEMDHSVNPQQLEFVDFVLGNDDFDQLDLNDFLWQRTGATTSADEKERSGADLFRSGFKFSPRRKPKSRLFRLGNDFLNLRKRWSGQMTSDGTSSDKWTKLDDKSADDQQMQKPQFDDLCKETDEGIPSVISNPSCPTTNLNLAASDLDVFPPIVEDGLAKKRQNDDKDSSSY